MSRTTQIALLVVDDDAIVRAWVRAALTGSEFRIAGEAARAAEAVVLAERRRPDLLLVDQLLPDWTGTDLVHELRRRGVAAPALLMTSAPREGLNETAHAAGIQGTVLKSSEPEQLLAALRRISSGDAALQAAHPRAARQVALSPREREILQLVAEGETNAEIGARLGIGRETVKTMLYRSFEKLGVRRRSEAVAEAQRLGLLVRPPELGG
ncbi:MAG: response regulator transcription factor [Acidobacteriota bacterium]|nr:response regulator transcription factor [Acidobacteriota bacterium]MDE3189678.1 response regulator transcription factor [Acidobacteriota bacterium]